MSSSGRRGFIWLGGKPASASTSFQRGHHLPIQSDSRMPVALKNAPRPTGLPPFSAAVRRTSVRTCSLVTRIAGLAYWPGLTFGCESSEPSARSNIAARDLYRFARIGRYFSGRYSTVWEVGATRLNRSGVRTEVSCPRPVATLGVQLNRIADGLLSGRPIDAVDLHEVVVDRLNVQLTLSSGFARPTDVDHRVTGATDGFDTDQCPHTACVVVAPLLVT